MRDFSFSTAKSHSNHHHQKKDFNLTAVSTDYKVSLLLRQAPSETEAQKDLEAALESGKCLLDDPREHDIVLDLAPALTSHRVSFHRSIPSSPGAAGLYSLIFVRCKPASASYHVNFRMDAVFANPGPNYLPAGETPFPLLYLLLCLLYCICLSLWIWVVCCSKNAGASTFMHHLMTALMALKCLSLLAESVRFHFIAQTGKGGSVNRDWPSGGAQGGGCFFFRGQRGVECALLCLHFAEKYDALPSYPAHRVWLGAR